MSAFYILNGKEAIASSHTREQPKPTRDSRQAHSNWSVVSMALLSNAMKIKSINFFHARFF